MLLKPMLAVVALVAGGVLYGVVPALLTGPENGEALKPFEESGFNNLGAFARAVNNLSKETPPGTEPHEWKVATLVGSPSVLLGLQDPSKVVYFAAGISRDYRDEEVNALIDFHRHGGRSVIMDDFGYANTLAQKFGIFYFGTDLWDLETDRYDRNITLPVVNFTFGGKEYYIELNGPTGLTLIQNPEVNTSVVAHCSEKCYADIDRSGTVNIGDKKGNISVIMRAQLQTNTTVNGVSTLIPTNGIAYFISDASAFTNDMMGKPTDEARVRLHIPGSAPGNAEFAKALIAALLPEGGTLVIDESRHLHSGGTQVVYTSFETAAVATSRAELSAALVGGAAVVLALIVVRAKDRENWIHKFDLSSFRPRAELPETVAVQVARLRHVARLKIQMTHSMSDDEFSAVPPDQLKTMIRDPMLVDLILNPARPWAPEELRPAAEHIRTWGK